MLILIGNDVVHYIEQDFDLDLKIVFFLHLADNRVLERLAEFDSSAGKFPSAALVSGLFAAFCKKDPAVLNEPPRSKLRGILKNLKQLQLL